MRITHVILGAALIAAFVMGCSKRTSEQTNQTSPPPNLKDLGAVQLTEQTPQDFSLGDGKGCTVTGRQMPLGISLKLLLLSTNADGTVTSSQGEIIARPGQPCTISLGGVTVGLTPTVKSQ